MDSNELYGLLFAIAIVSGIICASFCAFIAGEKKRDKTSWFILGLFFSFVALIAISGVPAKEPKQ